MSRPARYRKIEFPPLIKGFKPIGMHSHSDEVVVILIEEYEALRLLDFEYLNQEEAAKRMSVSRPTLTRIYNSARKKLAKALVNSLRIEIAGGSVEFEDEWFRCHKCHTVFQVHDLEQEHACPHCKSTDLQHVNDEVRNQPKRRHNYHQRHSQEGASGFCVCPQCGKRISHKPGKPCRKTNCPDCEVSMQRDGVDCR
jgi:predicted DNA-binding protein (UPF0251 family)